MRRYVCSVENGRTIPRMIRRILVPVDFSDTSTAALEYAMDVAARNGASLDVLHVWELPPYPAMAMFHDGDPADDVVNGVPSFAQHVADLATAQLDDIISAASRPGVEVRGLLESGDALRVIKDTAAGYDLIVIGAHDEHGAKGIFFGNVGDRVAGEVECPVVTVRAEQHTPTRRMRASSASHP